MPISAEERRKAILAQKAAQNKKVLLQTAAKNRMTLNNAGYVPDFSQAKQNPLVNPLPRANSDQAKFPEQPYGIQDPNWDYKTATLGPKGQELPEGAVGWTKHGLPWYGTQSQFSEWRKGIYNKVNTKSDKTFTEHMQIAKDLTNEEITSVGEYFGNLAGAVGGIFDALGAIGDGKTETTIIGKGSRALGQIIQGFGMAFAETADVLERGISTVADTADIAGGDKVDFKEPIDIVEKVFGEVPDNFGGDAARFISHLYQLTPAPFVKDVVRTAQNIFDESISLQEVGDIAEANWQAGRIMYSQWVDESIRQEYVARWRAGEDPYLLSLEYENIGAELIGEILLDPMTLYGMVNKANKAAKDAALIKKKFLVPNEHEIKFLTDAGNLSDTEVRAGIVAGRMEFTAKIENGLSDMAKGSMAGRSTISKQRLLANDVHNYLGMLVSEVTRKGENYNPHNIQEAIIATAKLATDGVDDAYDTFRSLGVSTNLVASEASGVTSVVLRDALNSMDSATFFKNLKKATTPDEVLGIIDPIIKKSTNKIIPSLSEKASNVEKFGELSKTEKGILKAEQAQKKLAGPNNFFAHVFMGMNPGFMNTNIIGNTMVTFLDHGPVVAAKSLVGSLEAAFRSKPKMMSKSANYVINTLGYTPADLFSGVGQLELAGEGKASKIFGITLEMSSKAETASSVFIYEAVIKDMVKKGWRPNYAIPAINKLTDAGWGLEQADWIQNVVQMSNTNVAEAEKIIRAEFKSGKLNMFEHLDWMNPKIKDDMINLGIFEDFKHVAKTAGSKETVVEQWKEILQGLNNTADDVAKDLKLYPIDTDLADIPKHLDDVVVLQQASTSDQYSFKVTSQLNANKASDAMHYEVLATAVDMANESGPDVMKYVDSVQDPARKELLLSVLNTEEGQGYWDKIYAKNKPKITLYDTWVKDARNAKIKKFDVEEAWTALKMPGKPPESMLEGMKGRKWFAKVAYEGWLQKNARYYFAGARDIYADAVNEIFEFVSSGSSISKEGLKKATNLLENARAWDDGAVINSRATRLTNGAEDFDKMVLLASKNGIPTLTDSAIPTNELMNKINAQLRADAKLAGIDAVQYGKLQDIPYDIAEDALKKRLGEKFVPLEDEVLKLFGETKKPVPNDKVLAPYDTGDMGHPQGPRMAYDAREAGLFDKIEKEIMRGIEDRYGVFQPIVGNGKDGLEEALTDYLRIAEDNAASLRAAMEPSATAARHFALHDYGSGKYNFDIVSSLVYPYGFWSTRTIPKYAKRIAQAPGLLSTYQRWRNAQAKIHSQMPEWWRYNANSNELFGLFPENPIFWDAERSLNSLNGLTGVDFEDPLKVTGWFTAMLNDLNRFGMGTHTLLNLTTAAMLYLGGNKDAASRWGSRLFPQITALGSAQSIAQSGIDLGPLYEGGPEIKFEGLAEKNEFGGTGIKNIREYDPVVGMLNGGVTPYEYRQAGRALAGMIEDGVITQEQANDAAYKQSGEIWDAAMERAVNERAVGQLIGFSFGLGMKGRTIADQQVDEFYTDFFSLMEQTHNLSQNEFAMSMNQLKDKYKFMDTLLISRKGGLERDTGLAYAVLSRIPPSSDLLKNIGLDDRLVQKFYEDKGQFMGNPDEGIEPWSQSDINKFMGSILDLSAVLAIPGDATRDEWDLARAQSRQLNDIMTEQFGGTDENGLTIHDKINTYLSFFDREGGSDLAIEFIKIHPEVEAALVYRDQVISTYPDSPLGTYYGGIDRIERYITSLAQSEAEKRFGEDIKEIQAGYYDDSFFTSDRKAYLREFPQLRQYWDFMDSVEDEINRRVVELGSKLGDPIGPEIRPDANLNSTGAQDVLEAVQGGQALTAQQWQQEIGQELFEAVARNIIFGEAMSNAVSTAVGRAAGKFDMKKKDLIQLVGISLIEAGVTGGQ
jgi:hypothetical protein